MTAFPYPRPDTRERLKAQLRELNQTNQATVDKLLCFLEETENHERPKTNGGSHADEPDRQDH